MLCKRVEVSPLHQCLTTVDSQQQLTTTTSSRPQQTRVRHLTDLFRRRVRLRRHDIDNDDDNDTPLRQQLIRLTGDSCASRGVPRTAGASSPLYDEFSLDADQVFDDERKSFSRLLIVSLA